MNENSITRVHYFPRQFIRTSDFTDEQAYHIAMRRRHNLAHHSRGIVRGLGLRYDEVTKVFIIDAGIAVDGYGREVILPESQPIQTRIFDDRAAENLDMYLEYRLEENDRVQGVDDRCLDEAGDPSISFYRWRESYRLTYVPADLDATNYSIPRAVPQDDHHFDATRTPPDTDLSPWPIFLGRIQRSEGEETRYSVSLTGRIYAGLVGAEIRRDDGMARISLTTEDGKAQFAFSTRESSTEPALVPLRIDADGAITIDGDTTIQGDVQVRGGLLGFDKMPTTGSTQSPWSIYVIDGEDSSGSAGASPSANPTTSGTPTAMRIELGDKSDERQPRLAIGRWSSKENKFKPILAIHPPEESAPGEAKVIITGTVIAYEFKAEKGNSELSDSVRLAATQFLQTDVVNDALLRAVQSLLSPIEQDKR